MIIIIYYNYDDSQFRNKKVFGFNVGSTTIAKCMFYKYWLIHTLKYMNLMNTHSYELDLLFKGLICGTIITSNPILVVHLFICSIVKCFSFVTR